MKENTIGILISKKNYSESSLILSFYTKNNGILSFIFKGAKKKKNPFFYLGIYEVSYFRRPESNLGIIHSLDSAVVLSEIYNNPQKLILSFFLVDILKETLKEESQDHELFNFIWKQILQLETETNLLLFPISFLTSYINYLGFSPVLLDEPPKGFELSSGRFTNDLNVYDAKAVQLLHNVFKNMPIESDKETAKKTLIILLDYYKSHIPSFNVKYSLNIIRETLYF